MDAAELFENAMKWLREHYTDYRFFEERDIAWTVQTRLYSEIERQGLPYLVSKEHKISPNRSDLAILQEDVVILAVEFKYEPSHSRSADRGGDIPPGKFDVVAWKDVKKDIEKVSRYVERGKVKSAYSIFIDEGWHFKGKSEPAGSEWQDWGDGRWALWSKWQ